VTARSPSVGRLPPSSTGVASAPVLVFLCALVAAAASPRGDSERLAQLLLG